MADRHGGVESGATAGLFARGGANAAQYARQRQVPLDNGDRLRQPAGGNAAKHGGNVEVRRASEPARREAIADVIAQKEFQGRASNLADFFRFALDFHALRRGRGAGRREPPLPDDLHHAHQAGRGRLAAVAEAERGDVDSQPAGGVQDRRPRRDFHFAMVDAEFWHK